jgi:3,4-dihydroxy 2-butanone 4-phosphate synthase/GTP cyclohydrolase II
MAGCEPAAVICEILKDDGTMARLPDLIEFAREHGLKIGTIRDLIQYRAENEKLVECVADKEVICTHGSFRLRAFRDQTSGEVHLTLTQGDIRPEMETLVRVHEPVSVLDFLDCRSQRHSFSVDQAMAAIAQAGCGVLVLLHRDESGNDLLHALQTDESTPAAKWDPRLYGIGAQLLRELGVGKMRLLASPRKMPSMAGFGLEVCGYLSSEGVPS